MSDKEFGHLETHGGHNNIIYVKPIFSRGTFFLPMIVFGALSLVNFQLVSSLKSEGKKTVAPTLVDEPVKGCRWSDASISNTINLYGKEWRCCN